MASLPSDADYYDLAVEDYDLTRQAIKRIPAVTTPETLSPDRLEKFVQMKAEYSLWAARLQAVSRIATQLKDDTLILGIRSEMARALVASGELAASGIDAMHLTREMMRLRFMPGHGAPFVLDFGVVGAYFPGFVDRLKWGEKDELPSLADMRSDAKVYSRVCRAAGLDTPADKCWWERGTTEPPAEAANAVRAAEAAECLLRVPSLLFGQVAFARTAEPYPLEAISDVLGGLTSLDNSLRDLETGIVTDMRRRRGRLLSEYIGTHESAQVSREDLLVLGEYQNLRRVDYHLSNPGK